MERQNRNYSTSFLNEISGPFIPLPGPEVPRVSIRTELPKLVKAGVKELNPDQADRLIDYYFRMNGRNIVKRYKEKHPDEYKKFHHTPTGEQIRLLRFIAFLLTL